MSDFIAGLVRDQLSPIADLLDDESVSEIMINGPHDIFVEKAGLIVPVSNKFRDESTLQSAVKAIANSIQRTIDKQNPRLDARLPDGSRVAVVLDGLAKCGTIVAIRKFSKEKLGISDLIEFGSISKVTARFLDICIYLGKNIVVSGGTGSGKTTMLNVLGGRVPKTQRLLINNQ